MNYKLKTKEIGKRIKENRKEMGMTQYDLIEKLHIGRNTLSDIENGKKLPDAETLYSLCEIFNCEVGYILCQQDKKVTSSNELITLRKLLDTIYHKEHIIICSFLLL